MDRKCKKEEEVILGGILKEKELIAKAHLEGLKEEDFDEDKHRLIYALITEMYEKRGGLWNEIELFDLIRKKGIKKLEREEIERLKEEYEPSLWADAIRVVKEFSTLRKCDKVASKILKAKSIEEVRSLKEAIETLTDEVKKEEKTIRDLVREELERIQRARESTEVIQGIKTGFQELDMKLLGLEGGQFVVVGARPGMGKSSFMLSMALKMAKKIRVGIFSLEMSAGQLIQRALSMVSGIALQRIRSGMVSDSEMEAILKAGLEISTLNLDIDDGAIKSVLEIKAKSKWGGYQAVFIDYLQLIKTEKRTSRQEEVAEISMSLKAMAKQLQVPVVALAQLNRNTEGRANKRPTLADLRESGQIEQDADIIIFLHRPEYYAKEKQENLLNRAEVIIAKNRQGPTGIVEMRFDKDTTGFYEASTGFSESEEEFEIEF